MENSNSFDKITGKKKRSSKLKTSLLRSNETADSEIVLNFGNKNITLNKENCNESTSRDVDMDHHERNFSMNEFSNNLNMLCLKTPERKSIPKSTPTKLTPVIIDDDLLKNKLPLFDITFDESSDIEENITENVETKESKPLEDTIVFVDVRAESENRSKAISRELERLGATIAEKIGSHVTHVVFKDGRTSTLNQLKKHPNIHFVSVLWVDSCKTMRCKVNEGLFPAKYPGSKEDQNLPMARAKRVKSLQPKTFEEDVNNSAKREERRKRRLKRLDKNYGTPKDQVICLDSQEYIKSSDLHKLVATPLAIPDTPWIINYINGSSESTTSPNDICSNANTSIHGVSQLSQDVQCKLKFDNEDVLTSSPTTSSSPKNRSSCLVSLGSSPTEEITNKQSDNGKRKIINQKNVTDMIQKTHRSPTKTTSLKRKSDKKQTSTVPAPTNVNSPGNVDGSETISTKDNEHPSNDTETIPLKRKSVGKTTFVNDTTASSKLNKENIDMVVVGTHDPSVPKPGIMKKKKKLLSKTRFALPQEKLISPALKEGRDEKKETTTIGGLNTKEIKKKKPKCMNISTNQNCPPNAYTMLQKLQQSKKPEYDSNVNKHAEKGNPEKNNKKPKLKNATSTPVSDDIQNEIVQSVSKPEEKNENNDEEDPAESEDDDNDDEDSEASQSILLQDNKLSVTCSRSILAIDYNETPVLPPVGDNDNNKKNIEESSPLRETPQQTSSICLQTKAERRRSKRKSLRNSAFDFKVSKTFRKPDVSRVSSKESSRGKEDEATEIENNTEEYTENQCDDESTENYINSCNNEDDINPNVSFVHDENEGLVCTLQKDGVVFNLDLSDESVGSAIKEQGKEVGENDGEICRPPNSTRDLSITTEETAAGLSTVLDSDSGISDSEEFPNDNNVHQEQNSTRQSLRKEKKKKNKQRPPRKLNATTSSSLTERSIVATKRLKCSIVFTSLHFGEQDFAKNVVKQLGGYKLKTIVAPDTTHIVSGEGRRTLNILHGIIKGCWILSPKWVSDSLEEGCWLDEEHYELSKDFPYAKISRLNRMRNGKSNFATLFAKIPRIYLAEVTSPSHEEMMRLITSCGGKLTNTIRKAGIAVGMVTCRRDDLKIVSEKWILDSITNGRIMATKTYEYKVPFIRREKSPDF